MTDKMVKSAVRVLAIFEAFDAEQRSLTISELVDLLQIPQSSMSTLIKSLVAKGFVEYDAQSRRYRPSVRLAFLGNWVLGSTDVVARLHSLAQRLSEETGETVMVGAENGLFMQYLSTIVSPQAMRFHLHPGAMRPLHRCGFGLMLLTQKDDADIGRIVRRYHSEFAEPNEVRMPESQIREMVDTARRQGWCVSKNLFVDGGASLATLIPLPIGNRTLAIGFGGPVNRLADRMDELRKTLLTAVAEFSGQMTPMNPREHLASKIPIHIQ